MAIRIKSERTHQLAKELAAMTGETQVSAIRRALEGKLDEIRRAKGECDVSPVPASNGEPQDGSSVS